MIRWNRYYFNSPSTNLSELIILINDYVIIFLFSIIILVLISLGYNLICKNFYLFFYEENKLEFLWTILPFITIFFILIPSIKSLYIIDSCVFCGIRLKILAHQWYWSYYYINITDIIINSYIKNYNDTNLRLLETDNRLIIPIETPIRLLATSADVIHSWALPSFGIKIDSIPGRINQICININLRGVFFGQCSEICGANHRFIPIVLESIKLQEFIKVLN